MEIKFSILADELYVKVEDAGGVLKSSMHFI